jgi:hypothetical protein
MKNISSISYHYNAFEEMLENQNIKAIGENDMTIYFNTLTASVLKILGKSTNAESDIKTILKLMDEYNDLIIASRVKFRINKIKLNNGNTFFQAKGAIGYEGKKKLWVNISLGNEKKVAEEYGTTDVDELKNKIQARIIWETYNKYRNLRKG